MASTIKVDNVQNQPGTNIINKCSTTITIGASSDTVALASGASQTGFGRTGTVDWQTDSIKTATFTATSGEGYFANTTGGAFNMNLPAGSAGSIVAVKDYLNTFDTYGLTIVPNGSDKIGGTNANYLAQVEALSLTLVYVDGTRGWVDIHESTQAAEGATYIVATGGTPCSGAIVCTNYKVHTFTGPGTFCVSSIGNSAPNNLVSYVVVGGGGGGGKSGGGGGGAGGYREVVSPTSPYTGSPLDGYPNAPNRITVSASPYTIAVGGGGAAQTPSPNVQASSGGLASFSTITGAGGSGGGGGGQCGATLTAGGSGGGGRSNQANPGGAGNTPPTTPAQGTAGGTGGTGSPNTGGGAGGGASAAGAAGGTPGNARDGGIGGAGVTSEITASPVAYSGGGGGGTDSGTPTPGTPGNGGAGGPGGGGAGGTANSPSGPTTGVSGGDNTGGGAGGGSNAPGASPNTELGGVGGSGVVIIRYKFQ